MSAYLSISSHVQDPRDMRGPLKQGLAVPYTSCTQTIEEYKYLAAEASNIARLQKYETTQNGITAANNLKLQQVFNQETIKRLDQEHKLTDQLYREVYDHH